MDSKYGKVTTERKTIPEDEPVFLLRGQDILACEAVMYYATLLAKQACTASFPEREHLVESVKECVNTAIQMIRWPVKKLPD